MALMNSKEARIALWVSTPEACRCSKGVNFSEEMSSIGEGFGVTIIDAVFSMQGTTDKRGECSTCKGKLTDCAGHFGHIRLALPVLHIGYFKHCIAILQCICKVGLHLVPLSLTCFVAL